MDFGEYMMHIKFYQIAYILDFEIQLLILTYQY